MDDEAVKAVPGSEPVPSGSSSPVGEVGEGDPHECGDPQCIGGTMMLDLATDEGFDKAVSITEANIMETALGAHHAVLAGRMEEGEELFDEVIRLVTEVDVDVLRAVTVGIVDIAAGMALHLKGLEDPDAPEPDLDDPGVVETFEKIDGFLADPDTGVVRERPANRKDREA
jgi:hypothetical protein